MSPALRTATAVVTVLLLVGCDSAGESAQNKAFSLVCDARADIAKQIETLRDAEPGSLSDEELATALRSIRGDIGTIRNAREDLAEARREEVVEASDEFAKSVQGTLQDLAGGDVSGVEGRAQLREAATTLDEAYAESLEPIECGD